MKSSNKATLAVVFGVGILIAAMTIAMTAAQLMSTKRLKAAMEENAAKETVATEKDLSREKVDLLLEEVNACRKRLTNLQIKVVDGRIDILEKLAKEDLTAATDEWVAAALTVVDLGTNLLTTGEELSALCINILEKDNRNLADGRSFEQRAADLQTGVNTLQESVDTYTSAVEDYSELVDLLKTEPASFAPSSTEEGAAPM